SRVCAWTAICVSCPAMCSSPSCSFWPSTTALSTTPRHAGFWNASPARTRKSLSTWERIIPWSLNRTPTASSAICSTGWNGTCHLQASGGQARQGSEKGVRTLAFRTSDPFFWPLFRTASAKLTRILSMNRWHPFGQLVLARLREFYREPEAVFWVYGFPLILAVGLGIAFSSKKPEPPDVDIQQTDNDT